MSIGSRMQLSCGFLWVWVCLGPNFFPHPIWVQDVGIIYPSSKDTLEGFSVSTRFAVAWNREHWWRWTTATCEQQDTPDDDIFWVIPSNIFNIFWIITTSVEK